MASKVAVTANAQLELMQLSPAIQKMAETLITLLADDSWRVSEKVELGFYGGEGPGAVLVYSASYDRVVARFTEERETGDVVVLHISQLSRFRYP